MHAQGEGAVASRNRDRQNRMVGENFMDFNLSFLSLCAQVSTVTVCVLRAAGAPTARCPVTVRTERPALLTRGPVSVLQGTEEPPVRGVSPTT